MSDTMTRDTTSARMIAARRAMIDSQLRTSGVNEEFALARMLAVPRQDYLPTDRADLAYIDRTVLLGDDAHLASPVFYGKLLVEAVPQLSDDTLIVEAGTRYLADLVAPLVREAATVSAQDAAEGTLPGGDYSLVLIDGAIEQLPDALAQVVREGGRVVSGLLLRGVTRLAVGRKVAGMLALQPVDDLGIPVLHAFDAPRSWTFS